MESLILQNFTSIQCEKVYGFDLFLQEIEDFSFSLSIQKFQN